MSMPLMDKWDIVTKPVFFLIPSPSGVDQDMPLAILVKKKKKNANACAHTSVILSTIKKWGRGQRNNTAVVRIWWNQIAVF